MMKTHTRSQHTLSQRLGRLGRAFSLIEVLIAILILALGLLGLGAVIPVVVREQRVASEATRAVIAANNAKAYLRARPDLNRLEADATGSRGGSGSPGTGTSPMGFGVWLQDLSWSSDGRWLMPSDRLWDAGYKVSGDLRPQGDGVRPVIALTDRLWPDTSSGVDPLLVWDFVARRVPQDPTGSPHADETERTIEIAVFVRRIDPAIRVPPGRTRLQVITGQGVTSQQQRLAIGVDSSRGPTGDGSGEYSLPIVRRLQSLAGLPPNRLRIDANDWSGPRAAQPGQKLVDNLGNIYTVTRLVDPNRLEVEITPPVSQSQRNLIDRVVFTPQIPAAVEVFRITIPRDAAQSPNGAGAGMSPWFGQVGQTP